MKVIIRVSIGDLVLRNSEVESLEVVQELGEHTRCAIEFTRDRAQTVALEDLLRAPVSVTVQEDEADPLEIFQGVVADGAQSHLLHFGARFVLDCVSPSIRHEFRDTRHFPRAKLGDVATKLGVKVVAKLPAADPFDFVQWGETEFEFLKRLADEAGCFLVTSGPQVEIRNEFVDKGWDLIWGESLIEVTARARPVNNGVTGASYDLKEKSTHAHAGIRSNPATLGGAAKLVATVNDLARGYAGGGDPILAEPFAVSTDHAEFKAKLRQESERAMGGALRVECVSGKPGLQAGDLVNLIEGKDFQLATTGKLGITRITNTFKDQQYLNRFEATPWKTFTSYQAPARVAIAGPIAAEVIDNEDPSKMGRVRVQYRWSGGDEQSYWARLATPHTGNGRGMMFIPEIGDEVLVVFLAGDPEFPVVVGGLWNGLDQAPEPTSGNTAKRIITRSGNTIQLLDDDGAETIEVFTPEGKCMVQLTNGDTPVITIKSGGDIALEAEGELRMKSKSFTQVVSGPSLKKVSGDDYLEVTGALTLKAGRDATLNGMNVALKGNMNVESVAGALNAIVGGMVHVQPPGFAGKPVPTNQVKVDSTDLGTRTTPEDAVATRTADPDTPRQG